jgi:outer membrane receptor protein involved in Fe transport
VVHQSAGALGDTRLKASAGLGIKEPTVLQSFSTSPFFLGNPALEPERSRTIDAGVEQRLAGDRAKVELTWFDNRYRNIISTRTISFDPFEAQYFNIGVTRARGLELVVDVVPAHGLQVRGGYTFLDSRILESTAPDDVVFAAGQWAFRRPRHAGFLDMGWTRGRLAADLNATFTGRYVDSDFSALVPPLVENPGYDLWNARLGVRLARQLTGIVSIDNLTGRTYMEPLGYQALGRAVRAGVRVAF